MLPGEKLRGLGITRESTGIVAIKNLRRERQESRIRDRDVADFERRRNDSTELKRSLVDEPQAEQNSPARWTRGTAGSG